MFQEFNKLKEAIESNNILTSNNLVIFKVPKIKKELDNNNVQFLLSTYLKAISKNLNLELRFIDNFK